MQHKKNSWKMLVLTALFMAISLVLPNLLTAQDAVEAAAKDKPASQDTSRPADSTDVPPASPLGLSWPDSYVRQIGTSGVLAGNREGIGWGSLYIPSMRVSGIFEKFEATSTQPGGKFSAALLQPTVVYDHRVGSGRIALQYAPSLAIADGIVVKDFSNQNASLDLLIFERPRWNVRFNDNFHYNYTQQSYGLPYLDVNPVTAGLAINGFLEGPGRWLSDSSYLSVGYAMTARSSISVTPNYTFAEAGEGINFTRAHSFGGTLDWNYRTSERQTVGVQYSGQSIRKSLSISPTSIDRIYHTVAGTMERQLSGTWAMSGALGVTTSTGASSPRQWNYYALFGLVKRLGRSAIGLNYSRRDTLTTGLISDQYADRVDLTYQNKLTRRLNWGAGGGYFRQVVSSGASGWYATANAQFLLAPRPGLFATFDYTHKNQPGNINTLFSGNLDTFVFGLLWEPSRLRR